MDPIKPDHYKLFDGRYQVYDLIDDRCNVMDNVTSMKSNGILYFHYGNAIKYLMRFPMKNGVEDLKKCKEYIEEMINELTE